MSQNGFTPADALLDLRAQIDRLDAELVAILARRVDLIVQAMPHKEGEPAAMEEMRRGFVITHVRDVAASHATLLGVEFEGFVSSLFTFMVDELISLQRKRGLVQETDPRGVVRLTNETAKEH